MGTVSLEKMAWSFLNVLANNACENITNLQEEGVSREAGERVQKKFQKKNLVPSTHMVAKSICNFSSWGCGTLFWLWRAPCTHVMYGSTIQTGKTPIYIKSK